MSSLPLHHIQYSVSLSKLYIYIAFLCAFVETMHMLAFLTYLVVHWRPVPNASICPTRVKQLYVTLPTFLFEMAEFVAIHWFIVNRVDCLPSMLLRCVSVEQSGLGYQ